MALEAEELGLDAEEHRLRAGDQSLMREFRKLYYTPMVLPAEIRKLAAKRALERTKVISRARGQKAGSASLTKGKS